MSSIITKYLEKFRRCPRQVDTEPHPDLGLSVVIPCYNEPHLLTTLDSLHQAQAPQCAVEVLVVINAPAEAPDSHHAQNQQALEELTSWADTHNTPRWQVIPLYFPALSQKEAGVGTARKAGMDEAVDRFAQVGRENGLVVCLDADCTCDPDYFQAIESHMADNSDVTGAAVYYEHPLDQAPSPAHRQAIASYELHLRFYVHALRWSGLPIACHTVGSTMVVRAKTYCQIGGMNRRKAGEDFYFMQKLAQFQPIDDIVTTRVMPSPRVSDRVPFGTGKAVGDLLTQGEYPTWTTYHPQSFQDLRLLIDQAPLRFANNPDEDKTWLHQIPQVLQDFLKEKLLLDKLQEIRSNTANPSNFGKRLFQWLNLFVAMKWVHFARDHAYPNIEVVDAAMWLLEELNLPLPPAKAADTETVLYLYRQLDRGQLAQIEEVST